MSMPTQILQQAATQICEILDHAAAKCLCLAQEVISAWLDKIQSVVKRSDHASEARVFLREKSLDKEKPASAIRCANGFDRIGARERLGFVLVRRPSVQPSL